jgi:hypothetical protein
MTRGLKLLDWATATVAAGESASPLFGFEHRRHTFTRGPGQLGQLPSVASDGSVCSRSDGCCGRVRAREDAIIKRTSCH